MADDFNIPAFGEKFRGKIGNIYNLDVDNIGGVYQIYHTREGKKVLRRRQYGANYPGTPEQVKQNQKLQNLALNWNQLTDQEKNVYKQRAREERTSPFSIYWKENY